MRTSTRSPRRRTARSQQLVRLTQLSRSWGATIADIRRACREAGVRIVRLETSDGISSPALEPDSVATVMTHLDQRGLLRGGPSTGPTSPVPDVRSLPDLAADTCWGPGDALDGSRPAPSPTLR